MLHPAPTVNTQRHILRLMGFSFVSFMIPKCLNITLLLLNQLVGCFKFTVKPIVNHLGLIKRREQQQQSECPPDDRVLVMVGSSFISVPVNTLTSFIKRTLPVVEYGEFQQRSTATQEHRNEEEDMECSVCLESLDRTHLIRELCNCSHVFHQHCLDAWLLEGQVTCPICRSMLFQTKGLRYKHLLHHD